MNPLDSHQQEGRRNGTSSPTARLHPPPSHPNHGVRGEEPSPNKPGRGFPQRHICTDKTRKKISKAFMLRTTYSRRKARLPNMLTHRNKTSAQGEHGGCHYMTWIHEPYGTATLVPWPNPHHALLFNCPHPHIFTGGDTSGTARGGHEMAP